MLQLFQFLFSRHGRWFVPLMITLMTSYIMVDRDFLRRLGGMSRQKPYVQGPAEVVLGGLAEWKVPAGGTYIGEFPDTVQPEGVPIARLNPGFPPPGGRKGGSELALASDPGELADVLVLYHDGGEVPEGDGVADLPLPPPGASPREFPVTPPEVTGWARPPSYDSQRHLLLWAVRGLQAPEKPTGSYYEPGIVLTPEASKPYETVVMNARLLGREGVLSLVAPASREGLAKSWPQFEALARSLWFKPGQRYGDWSLDWRRAPFGLRDLVQGSLPPPDSWQGPKRRLRHVVQLASFGFFLVALAGYAVALRTELRRPDEPRGPEPAFRQYFFGKWWDDYLGTVNGAVAGLQRVTLQLSELGSRRLLNVLIGLGQYESPGLARALTVLIGLLILPGLVAAGAAYVFLGMLHFTVGGAVCLAVVVTAGLFWLLERMSMAWRSIFLACPNRRCYRKVALPVYLCPCGAEHRQLVPGPYGTFGRRCRCGRTLPTLFLTGRHRLSAVCPHCQGPLSSLLTRSLHVPVVGPPGAGKTTYLMTTVVGLSDVRFPLERDALAVARAAESLESLAKTADLWPDALLVELPDGRQVFLYDSAGEAYGDFESLRAHEYFSHLHGVLFLVDGRGSPAEAQEVFDRMVRAYRELASLGQQRSDRPVAVVVTKADLLGSVDPKEWLEAHGHANLVRCLESSFSRLGWFAVSSHARQGLLEPWRHVLA